MTTSVGLVAEFPTQDFGATLKLILKMKMYTALKTPDAMEVGGAILCVLQFKNLKGTAIFV